MKQGNENANHKNTYTTKMDIAVGTNTVIIGIDRFGNRLCNLGELEDVPSFELVKQLAVLELDVAATTKQFPAVKFFIKTPQPRSDKDPVQKPTKEHKLGSGCAVILYDCDVNSFTASEQKTLGIAHHITYDGSPVAIVRRDSGCPTYVNNKIMAAGVSVAVTHNEKTYVVMVLDKSKRVITSAGGVGTQEEYDEAKNGVMTCAYTHILSPTALNQAIDCTMTRVVAGRELYEETGLIVCYDELKLYVKQHQQAQYFGLLTPDTYHNFKLTCDTATDNKRRRHIWDTLFTNSNKTEFGYMISFSKLANPHDETEYIVAVEVDAKNPEAQFNATLANSKDEKSLNAQVKKAVGRECFFSVRHLGWSLILAFEKIGVFTPQRLTAMKKELVVGVTRTKIEFV